MSWHYQVRERTLDGKKWYDVVECYEDFNGWTESSMSPCGESKEEVIKLLEMMLSDAKHYPVLEEA